MSTPKASNQTHLVFLPKRTDIVLDRESAIQTDTEFRWNVHQPHTTRDDEPPSTTNQALLSHPLERFYKMQIHPFTMCMGEAASFWQDTLSVLIKELSGDAYVAQRSYRRFHFILYHSYIDRFDPDSITIDCKACEPNGNVYNCKTFVDGLNTITLSFGNPLELLRFPPMIYLGATAALASPTVFTLTGDYHAATGITKAVITGFTTGDPVTDAATITAMNATHTTITPVLTGTTFTLSIPVDTSTVTPGGDLSAMRVIFPERNFQITVSFIHNIEREEK